MDPDTPSTTRMIDYWLGGTDHFPVDVAAAQAFESLYGPCAHEFQALRGFLARSVRHLHEQGLEEFLVFGAGVPTLDDEQLARLLDDLYQGTAPGSQLTFDFDSDVLTGHPEALAMMGPNFHMRRPDDFARLLGRWQLTGEGIAVVADWPKASPPDVEAAFFGGVAVH